MSDPTQAMPTPGDGDGRLLGGRYRLESVAGRGGMAEVWRAHDTLLDRVVAVKWFIPGAGDVAAPARQQAEMKMLASFNHPGLVTVYDAGVEPGPNGDRAYVVMEFVDGPTLADRLKRGPLPLAAVTAIGSSVASALAYVHGRGVVHRDVKPGNILLEGGDDAGPTTVKLADFGIARIVDDARVTKTGMTVGTASYLSPEQVRGDTVTAASDVYSLALVLLEAITGRVEFPGTPIEAAVARLNRDPVIPPGAGPVWGPLLTAMTAREPAARPTAADVAARLSGTPGATGPQSATTSYIPPAGLGGTAATQYLPRAEAAPSRVVSAGGSPPVGPPPPVRAAWADALPPGGPPPRAPRPVWPWVALVALLIIVAGVVAFLVTSGNGDPTGTVTTPPVSASSTPSTTAPTTASPTPSSTPPSTPRSTVTVTEPPPSSSPPSSASTAPSTDTSSPDTNTGAAGQGGTASLVPPVGTS